jgi:hypothetical protein
MVLSKTPLFFVCCTLVFLFGRPEARAADIVRLTDVARVIGVVRAAAATDSLPMTCGKSVEIERIISEAISLGAPIYNEGMHMACYRIYEWAGYKILYEYGSACPEVERVLKAAIEKSHGDLSDTEKAWLMRMAFDKIMGVPTKTKDTEKDDVSPRKG